MKARLHYLRATIHSVVIYCAIVGMGLCSQSSAIAQAIRADNTLTSTGSVTTTDNQNFNITGGTQLGSSLFHGFDAFSVPTNGSAVFDNATSVTNIFSRVTGGQASTIDGLIKANGANTNIFFLNRSGITFGPNAQLQIGGSFLASTAESVAFNNGIEFATDTTPLNPLLSISTPIGLQLNAASGAINVIDDGYAPLPATYPNITLDSSASLRVNPGQTLALISNGINFDGGVVATPGGHIELGSVDEGFVSFDSSDWSFDYSTVQSFNDMDFSARSLVDTSSLLFNGLSAPYAFGARGGSVQLRGRHITFREASRALIQNYSAQDSGSINAIASDTLELVGEFSTGERGSSLATMNYGTGNGGHLEVISPRLLLIGDASIGTDTFTTVVNPSLTEQEIAAIGMSGNVTIKATETIRFESNQEAIPDYSQINVGSFGTSAAGTLTVVTGDLVILGDGISSQSVGVGPGGLVVVDADTITVEDGGSIAASTLFYGRGGDVEVTADTINLRGISPRSFLPSTITAPTTGAGDAGNVTVSARQISLLEGARIDSSALAAGDSGIVTITASESLTVDGTVPGTDIPSLIISSANIASPEIRGFFATIGVILPPAPSGTSGSVVITTPKLAVTNGAQVTVRNDGTGDAGALRVDAGSVYVSDRAAMTASTQQGNGGNIIINSQGPLLLRQGSRLSAEAQGAGTGGNVTLNAPAIIALENSDITASAIQGAGGNIQINANAILGTEFREQLTPESDITASSQFGASGVVEINTIKSDPNTGAVSLPENLADSSGQIVASCSAGTSSQFIATGRGGLPTNPADHLTGNQPWVDIRDADAPLVRSSVIAHEKTAGENTVETNTSSETSVVEAVDFTLEANGDVTLVIPAYGAHSTAIAMANCLT